MNNRLANNVWIKLIVIIVAAVVAFVVIRERTKVNTKDIGTNTAAIKTCVEEQIEDRLEMREMKSDVKHIKEDVGTMSIEQKTISKAIGRIEVKLGVDNPDGTDSQ